MRYGTLKENHLFGKCYSGGARCATKTLVLYKLRDKRAGVLAKSHPQKKKINRTGITVSKKIGNAVRRNSAKRKIREAFVRLYKENEIKTGFLLVCVARESINTESVQRVYSDLLYAAKKTALTVVENDLDNESDN